MAKVKTIKTHLVKHIWMAYAKKLIAEDPDNRYGRSKNKISNYYVFEKTRSKSIMQPSEVKEKLVMDYEQFRKVIERYFERARTAIIEGKALEITSIGKIYATRVERDFTKKNHRQINWQKTREYADKHGMDWDEEKKRYKFKKRIYFTDPDWCRIAWGKNYKVVNISMYEFKPTSSSSREQEIGTIGFQDQFCMALNADKTLRYRFVYQPIYRPNKTA